MSERLIRSSAPGSLMLMGEHAVLHGQCCLVSAVNRRMRVSLRPRPDDVVHISSALGTYTGRLPDLEVAEPFRFVLAALQRHAAHFPSGLDMEIDSDFSSTVGLGSSAAVTVAVHAACIGWWGRPLDRHALVDAAVETIQNVQGMGSGADVAASVFGGTVAYRAEPREVRPLQQTCPLTVVYSGGKTPTPEVVAIVEAARKQHPDRYNRLFERMGGLCAAAESALTEQDWPALGRLMDTNQELLDALGVNNAALSDIVERLRALPEIHGAKISGSGLGDCVVGLGHAEGFDGPYEVLDVDAAPEGVSLD